MLNLLHLHLLHLHLLHPLHLLHLLPMKPPMPPSSNHDAFMSLRVSIFMCPFASKVSWISSSFCQRVNGLRSPSGRSLLCKSERDFVAALSAHSKVSKSTRISFSTRMWLEQNALQKIELAPSSNCIATSMQPQFRSLEQANAFGISRLHRLPDPLSKMLDLDSQGLWKSPVFRYMSCMEVSINGGSPIAGWFIMENPSING